MSAEPVGISLAALALLEPAVRACRNAYGVYQLTKHVGQHYQGFQRRLRSEQARLELVLNTRIACMPTSELCDSITEELGSMRQAFQGCHELVLSIDKPQAASNSDLKTAKTALGTEIPAKGPHGRPKPFSKGAKSSLRSRMLVFRRKGSGADSEQSTTGSSTPPSSTLNSNDASSSMSSGTPAVPTLVRQGLEQQEVLAAAALQEKEGKRIQGQATLTSKVKWTAAQRKAFLGHLDQLHSSNNTLESIVTMQAMLNIHESVVIRPMKEDVPFETLETVKGLKRLHFALIASNKASPEEAPMKIGVRIMEPAVYAKRKKQLQREHGYIVWSQEGNIYPLQLENTGQTFSRMILVDTQRPDPQSGPGQEPETSPNLPLSSMICVRQEIPKLPAANHMEDRANTKDSPIASISSCLTICNLDPDADESFRIIGNIACPTDLEHSHRLYQDISLVWKRQITLLEIVGSVPKSNTFVGLALHIALSYVYLVSLGTVISYPRLADYRYYDAAEGTSPTEPDHEFELEQILEPYLCVSFGSKAPKKSTRDIGGLTNRPLFDDEAMTELGVTLHQVGTWKVLPEKDLGDARRKARASSNELTLLAGTPYAQVVGACLDPEAEDGDAQARAHRIYKKVVFPLQRIIKDLQSF